MSGSCGKFLCNFFSQLPTFSDIGARVNLISPIFSACAVMFLYLIIWGRPLRGGGGGQLPAANGGPKISVNLENREKTNELQ